MSETYRAGAFERLAQRFINPLYVMDGCGGYQFSSTMTFLTYRDEFYCIGAAHGLPERERSIDRIGFLGTDGNFLPVSSASKRKNFFGNLISLFTIALHHLITRSILT